MRRSILIAAVATMLALPSSAFADPTALPRCESAPPAPDNCTGWYIADVRLTWTIVDADESNACNISTFTKDDVYVRSCSVRDLGQPWSTVSVTIRLDGTPPVVTSATPSRGPDANGWYRSPLQISFSGSDATSGVLGCSSGTYSGPDAAAAQVSGRCWDRAGNVSAPSAFDLRYDATAPSLAQVTASGRDHKARLDWAVPDAVDVDVRRGGRRLLSGGPSGNVVDRGLRNGRRYEYVVSATDAAGNTAKRTLTVVPGPRLLGPAAGKALSHPPRLRWTEIRGADYYNVQLFRGRRKILSAWPTKPRLQLDSKWRYAGHKRRLKPGKRYRWLVWPGDGPRSNNDYGRLIGARTFVITP
jgi:hypothetical protein